MENWLGLQKYNNWLVKIDAPYRPITQIQKNHAYTPYDPTINKIQMKWSSRYCICRVRQ